MPPDDAAPPGPVILIQADPRLSGGYINDRFDVLLRGRVLSASPTQDLTLRVDDAEIATLRFGDPAHAAPVQLPDGRAGFQRTFHFNLPRPGQAASGPCVAAITAVDAMGETVTEQFHLLIDTASPAPVTLTSGPVQPIAGDAGIRAPIVSYAERASIDSNGVLQVHGWAIALSHIVAVQAFIGDTRVGAAILGGRREDVAYAFPAYPNAIGSGFALIARLTGPQAEAASVRIQATGQYGFVHEIHVPLERVVTAPVSAPPVIVEPPAADDGPMPEVNMYCDIVSLTEDGHLQVSGWAVCPEPITAILIHLDDVLVGEAERGRDRPDVGAEFPAIADAARAGFLFDRRVADQVEGHPVVRVAVRLRSGRERSENLPIGALLPRRSAGAAPLPAVASPAAPERFRFELDSPRVVNGAVPDPITGRLTIEGWVLAQSGVAGIEVMLDGQRLGQAHHGLARQDVAGAFPEWDNALRSGYAFHCPPRGLRDGDHTVEIIVRANDGAEHRESFAISVRKPEGQEDSLSIRRRIARAEADLFEALSADLTARGSVVRPGVEIYVRQDGPVDVERLCATLESMRLQCIDGWRVTILASEAAQRPTVLEVLQRFEDDLAGRVSVLTPDDAAWQQPISGPDESLIGILCPGDELGGDALAEFVLNSLLHPAAGLFYADEARLSPVSHEREPFFKPDFSPDLLLSTNYIGRPWVARAACINTLGCKPESLMTDGEYDLLLRLAERIEHVRHVPKLLCLRGPADLDEPARDEAALRRAVARRGILAEVVPSPVAGTWWVNRAVRRRGKVSIIIPTCAAHGYIETCINTLRSHTAYEDYEIIVIDNIPGSQLAWKVWVQQHADKIVDMPDAFNWSRFNNLAADVAEGEYLLFLNDDIEIEQEDWLDIMVANAERPDVGVVGARLLYPDRKIQHAGMFLANNGIGRHAFRFAAEDEPGYFGLALTQRNVIAVTGACLLVRRDVFEALGRFDEAHEIVNNDLDFCLRAHKAGLLTVFTPYATLIHHELASRDRLKDVFDLSHFNSNWKTLFAAGDPYFNPALSRHADDYRPEDEAVEIVTAGYPMFRAADIRRILVVKLDHIGDFVTALPAIRHLKQIFPNAHLTVLAGPASRAFASMEPSIDAFIEFAFFHARSQLGERELTAEDFAALAAELRPHRFDLAVDLRKHLSTRDVLRHTGARFLAGFDYMGQFPFLDISMEWDGDKALHRKRGHVVDALMSLVTLIGMAAASDRQLIQPRPGPAVPDDLPDAIRGLFTRPVVAIHAGAGNITKEWPPEHFAALIDMLVEQNGVNALIIGGADEAELAETLMAALLHPDSVGSVVGKTSLSALPRILAACTLYIGNDSGPKHIAAGLGVPTIGIHSGVVDTTEWGPVGPRAVALRRNMTCSPCYLAIAADCPRDLACLRRLEPALVLQTAQAMLATPIAPPPPNPAHAAIRRGTSETKPRAPRGTGRRKKAR